MSGMGGERGSHRYVIFWSFGNRKWYWRLYGGTRIIADGSQGYVRLSRILEQVMKARGDNSNHQVWIQEGRNRDRYA